MSVFDDVGGDPVCWLDRVCPDCGALTEAESCWRCGAPTTAREDVER